MKNRIEEVINSQIDNLKNLKESDYSNKLIEISNLITKSIEKGGKILIAGNGGSAADAQHFAAELVGRFMKERKALAAIALTTDSSVLTCMGNDYGFNDIFDRQIEALGHENDIFFGISTSGNSENIIRAVNKAKDMGIKTVGLLGKDGGKLKELCDYNMILPYKETARVQEHHIMTIHLICEFVENYFYEKK